MASQRITFIDGLRGLAIVSVFLFHAYVSTPADLPFGARFAITPIRLGWAGVELFFLISGFVILMTLENTSTPWGFAFKRWLRLFPGMVIASGIIVAFDSFVGWGPASNRSAMDAIPGLIFLPPALIHSLTGVSLQSLDTPFWSLYVEVAFYVVFGLVFFLFGRRMAITAIFSLAVLSYIANAATEFGFANMLFGRIARALDWMGFTYFAWFASGALFYNFFCRRETIDLVLACFAGLTGVVISRVFILDLTDRLGLLSVLLVFAAAILSKRVQAILSSKLFMLFGFISYPFYLIHNNILIGTETMVAWALPTSLSVLAPIPPLIALTTLAWLIAKHGEPMLRRLLTRAGSLLSVPRLEDPNQIGAGLRFPANSSRPE